MARKISTGNVILSIFMVFVLAIMAYWTFYITLNFFSRTYDMEVIKTKEPLMIEAPGPGDNNYYILPQDTVLYRERGMAQEQQLYIVYFYHKGSMEQENVSEDGESSIDPLWLYNIAPDTLKTIRKRFPLSKENIIAAIKANKITRDDLADIVRSLPK